MELALGGLNLSENFNKYLREKNEGQSFADYEYRQTIASKNSSVFGLVLGIGFLIGTFPLVLTDFGPETAYAPGILSGIIGASLTIIASVMLNRNRVKRERLQLLLAEERHEAPASDQSE